MLRIAECSAYMMNLIIPVLQVIQGGQISKHSDREIFCSLQIDKDVLILQERLDR